MDNIVRHAFEVVSKYRISFTPSGLMHTSARERGRSKNDPLMGGLYLSVVTRDRKGMWK
jgi:hypothetical protein